MDFFRGLVILHTFSSCLLLGKFHQICVSEKCREGLELTSYSTICTTINDDNLIGETFA